ncbi:hypothetical protein EDB81DRAFT_695724, partial [Dactylonectria macrodidyma]
VRLPLCLEERKVYAPPPTDFKRTPLIGRFHVSTQRGLVRPPYLENRHPATAEPRTPEGSTQKPAITCRPDAPESDSITALASDSPRPHRNRHLPKNHQEFD